VLSAAAAANEMGPSKGIGSICRKKEWAQAKSSAAASANAMGPSKGIDSTCKKKKMGPSEIIGSCTSKYNGPTCTFRTFLIDGPTWVFPSVAVNLHMGSSDYYDINLCHYVGMMRQGSFL